MKTNLETDQELVDERYEYLTENLAGISTLMSEFVDNDCWETIEESIYKIWIIWSNSAIKSKDQMLKAADELCHLLDVKAIEFAQKWADKEMIRLSEEGPEPDDGYLRDDRIRAIEKRGVTGYAN